MESIIYIALCTFFIVLLHEILTLFFKYIGYKLKIYGKNLANTLSFLIYLLSIISLIYLLYNKLTKRNSSNDLSQNLMHKGLILISLPNGMELYQDRRIFIKIKKASIKSLQNFNQEAKQEHLAEKVREKKNIA